MTFVNFVFISETFTEQSLEVVSHPDYAQMDFQRLSNLQTLKLLCMYCNLKTLNFFYQISNVMNIRVAKTSFRYDISDIVVMEVKSLIPKESQLSFSPHYVGHDKLAYAFRPRSWSSQTVPLAVMFKPLDDLIWLCIGSTWASAFILFLVMGLLFRKKHTFYYTGRKLLEVMAVIRWPQKKDSAAGKLGALVYKTGLSIVFIAYVQLLVKSRTHHSNGSNYYSLCGISRKYELMYPPSMDEVINQM